MSPGLGDTLNTMARIFVREKRELVLKSDAGKERMHIKRGEKWDQCPSKHRHAGSTGS